MKIKPKKFIDYVLLVAAFAVIVYWVSYARP